MESEFLDLANYRISPEDLVDKLATYQLLPQLWQQLRLDEATATINPKEDQIQQSTQQWLAAYQISSPEQLQVYLNRQQQTQQQWQTQILRQLKISIFQQNTWGEQLESYFLSHKPQLDRVIYSLIRTNDSALIQELYFRLIESEASWPDIAGQYSSGIEAQTGGLIGPVELGSCNPIIAQQLKSAQAGQIIGPLKVQDALVLLRLERFLPASLDESTRQRLLDNLMREWLEGEWSEVKSQESKVKS
jgi:parvulin-like peptidyl-prolyl isomerase